MQDLDHEKRVKKVSYKLNIPEKVIEEILQHSAEYIKNKVEKPEYLDLDLSDEEDITEEEFKKKYPIIKIPSLGYLKPSFRKYKIVKKLNEKAKTKDKLNIKNKNNTFNERERD